ncbi:MAG: 7TM diverse intracellular signaling domain-containing protein, partial [Spirochaetota bacterium]
MKRKTGFTLLILIIVLSFFTVSLTASEPDTAEKVKAEHGVIDLAGWDFGRNGIVKLDGEWEFFWKMFISSGTDITGEITLVPGSWTAQDNFFYPAGGYAAYRLKVELGPDKKERMALWIPYMATSYEAYVNGKLISSNGKIGTSGESAEPQYLNTVSSFDPQDETEIVIYVSNYSHRLSGIWESIRLGTETQIKRASQKAISYQLILLGSFIVMAMYHFGLFLLRREDLSPLYFSLICLALAFRNITTGEVFLTLLYPSFPWDIELKIEYISFFAVIPLFVGFYHTLFKGDSIKAVFPAVAAA